MREHIEGRVLEIAKYILDTGATVRASAAKYGVSKTTVHKDMRERLPEVDASLAKRVARVLLFNKAERHIRGGLATKHKYKVAREARAKA